MSKVFKTKLLATAVVLAISPVIDAEAQQDSTGTPVNAAISQQLPNEARILAVSKKTVDHKKLTFVKYESSDGEVVEQVFDEASNPVSEKDIPVPRRVLIAKSLNDAMKQLRSPNSTVRVNISLPAETVDEEGLPGFGSAAVGSAEAVLNGEIPDVTLDGSPANMEFAMQTDEARLRRISEVATRNRQRAGEKLSVLAARHGWSKHPAFLKAIKEGNATVTIDLTRGEIAEVIRRSGDLISGVELYDPPKDQIASAMLSSRVDPYAINYAGRKGGGVGIYMTESGCPNAGHITRYQKLAGTRTDHSENVSAIMRSVSPESYVYCRGGAVLPSATDLNGYNGNPRINIINRSNGGGDNDDYTTIDRDWDNFVYDNAVSTFVSAGNNGNSNGYLIYPSKGLNIISVGAYDDANNTIASFSSFKNPETKNAKPEISLPGVSITAGGHTMSGTSMSSPHGAAFAADMMSAYSWFQLKPYLAKAMMLAGSTKSIAGGFDKVGLGGSDFYSAYYNYYSFWWYGGNGSFSYFDSTDPLPNNGYVDAFYNLSSALSNVRVTFAWLNRGSYTYDHRFDAHPIGMDLDVAVFDPNGNFVTSSSSFDNPYEALNFDPQVSGNYRFRISRYANRDASSKLHMGLVINW